MNEVTKVSEDTLKVTHNKLRQQLADRAQALTDALPAHIPVEKFQSTVLTATLVNPSLLTADRGSLVTACLKAAQDGLLPDGREAALVVYKTSTKDRAGNWSTKEIVQYLPMVYGLRKKVLQTKEVKSLSVGVVYRQEMDKGLFHYEEGTDRQLRHQRLELLDPSFEPKDDDIIAAYSVAVMADGTVDPHVITRSYINRVRQASQTGALLDRKGKPRTPKGPWVDWFPEQCLKTALRSHTKTLPMSGDIVDVEAVDAQLAARQTVALLAPEPEQPRIEKGKAVTEEVPDDERVTGPDEVEEPPEEQVDQTVVEPEPDEEQPEQEVDLFKQVADRLIAKALDDEPFSTKDIQDMNALPDEYRADVDAAFEGLIE